MGKRKQKVRWCSVDTGISWSVGDQVDDSLDVSNGVTKAETVPASVGGTRRSSAQGWTSSLAPRFERKAAAEAEQKHIYYEGEFCEAEDLPNGFTKIRSKNLDILFKRDYYEQKLAAQQLSTDHVKSSESNAIAEDTEEVQEEEKSVEEAEIKPPTTENMDSMTEPETAAKSSSWSFDQIDPDDIQEFKPMNPGLVSLSCDIESGAFYGSYPPHPHYPDSSHPHLYLYSPTDNSLIPCEEIIIPNPVMSPEGPVYSGPTNIYLAYPVQGPDGKGYITQPFATPGSAGSYLSQESASYSPSISYDGSNYYSSTQQDSGSSSQPTSPPPLATYHPTSWINQDQPSLSPHERHNTEGCYDPQPMDRSAEKCSPARSTTTTGSTVSSTTATYIPGLSLDSKRISPKKSQKRRKKKKVTSSLEQQRSSTSESENLKMEEFARHDNSESIHDKIDSEQFTGILVPEVTAEPIQEVYLTDDLADSLVNPPTEPEISDEEISQESISLLSTYSSVEVSENKFGVARTIHENKAENGFKMDEDESNKINSEVVPEMKSIEATVQSEVPWMVENVLMENCSADSITGDIEHTEEKKETLEGEFNANTKCGGLFDVPVKKVEDRTEAGNKVIKAVPEIKKSQKKTRTRNQKVELDSVVKSESKSLVLKSEDQSISTNQAMKKSYSSVMKCNLVRESNNNPTISCKPDMETVTRPTSLLPHSSDCSASQDNTEKDSDTWEKVPLNSFKPEIKGKTSKKRRKHTRTIIEDSLLLEELPELEIVPKFANCTNTLEETNRKRQEADREVDLCDDIEVEKRKLRKKKKFETKNTSHRVIICDDQISLRYSTAARRASEVLPTSILDTVKTSGYCDFLVIRELGSGIFRGCMDFGRLYQGKYIPPERTDGLPAWCEEESVIEEEIAEEVIGEETSSTASADIDLD